MRRRDRKLEFLSLLIPDVDIAWITLLLFLLLTGLLAVRLACGVH